MSFKKSEFFKTYSTQLVELDKRQRKYRKVVSTSLASYKDTAKNAGIIKSLHQYRKEKTDLHARVWVTQSATIKKEDKRNWENVRCQVDCQEQLALEIAQLKENISKTERVNNRLDKDICAIKRKSLTDVQHQKFVERSHRQVQSLDNQLENTIKAECVLKAENKKLREEIVKLLNSRTIFHSSYSKLITQLACDKKYLIDLVEYVIGTFETAQDFYDKMNHIAKKEARDSERIKEEMEKTMSVTETEKDLWLLLDIKGKRHSLPGITPKEKLRREQFHLKYGRKIALYTRVLDKISAYTKTHKISMVIDNYRQQESLYYSYFNYANEVSYHVTLVDHAVSRLFRDIGNLRTGNKETYKEQMRTIEQLEDNLKKKQKSNQVLAEHNTAADRHLNNLLNSIAEIFEISRTDAAPLLKLLGDHTRANLFNLHHVLKLLEQRIFRVAANVYIRERLDESRPIGNYTVQQLHKLHEWPTALTDIVLATQCSECAEGDAFNADEAVDAGIHPNTRREGRRKLYERVLQSEMQYRLHNIEECRLPRSRTLATRKNI